MRLYQIRFICDLWYVEAPNLVAAVRVWKENVAVEWGETFEGSEEPDSITMIHDNLDESVVLPFWKVPS